VRSIPLAAALLPLLLPACSGGGEPDGSAGHGSPQAPRWVVTVAAGLEVPVEIAGSRVPPGSQAAVYAGAEGGDGPGGVPLGHLGGLPMQVVGGMLRIGEVGRGPLPAGASLRLAPEGVFVDGEFRGPLPLP